MCEIIAGGVLMASIRDDVSKYIKKKLITFLKAQKRQIRLQCI